MTVSIAIFDAKLRMEIEKIATGLDCMFVNRESAPNADIIFASEDELKGLVSQFAPDHRPSLFVTLEDRAAELPAIYLEGIADDILVTPVRRHEFLSRVRWHYHLQHLRELESTSASVPALVKKLEEDLLLAEKIQRRLIRDKFPPMPGVMVKSKYWCGMRSGGDYFDVIDFPGGQFVGFLLTDSSSYSLSSNLLSTIMHQSLQVPAGETPIPEAVVAKVLADVPMGEKDKLSIFFAVLDRKTYKLNFVCEGTISACKRGTLSDRVEWLTRGQRPMLTAGSRVIAPHQSLRLDPEDRLLFFSDGWSESMGADLNVLIEQELGTRQDSQKLVNEFSFQLRQSLQKIDPDDDEPMPPQDCSVLVVDIEKNILRLA